MALALAVSAAAWATPSKAALAQYQRGLELKRAGKPAEAATALQAAVRADPKYMEAHYALGWVYRQLGLMEKAIESLREVIRLAPHSPEAVEAARAIQRIRLGPEAAGTRRADRVAYVSQRDGITDLYLVDVASGAARKLTSDAAVESFPAWSPDGRRLAYGAEAGGNRDIWVMNADGSGARRLTTNPAADDHPVWSRDGQMLLFETNRGGSWDIWAMSPDGSGERPVVAWPSDERLGGWSPDGKKLALLSSRDGMDKVYLVDANGTNLRPLLAGQVPEGRPVWDPSGEALYFTWQLEHNAQVCRAALAGGRLANVTRSPYNDELCDISPDGQRLLIQSDRHGASSSGGRGARELYELDLQTGAAQRLTLNPGDDREGAFAP